MPKALVYGGSVAGIVFLAGIVSTGARAGSLPEPAADVVRPRSPEHVRITYFERPPFHMTVAGEPRGQLIEITRRLAEDSGLRFDYEVLPPLRIQQRLRENQEAFCALGMIYSDERARVARFSLPIAQDAPVRILARRELAPTLQALGRFETLLADPRWTWGTVKGYSYGPALDARLRSGKVRYDSAATPRQNLDKLLNRRVDYYLTTDAEWRDLQVHQPQLAGRFALLKYPDSPPGKTRYLLCSDQVADSVLQRLNASILNLRLIAGEGARTASTAR